MIIEHNEYRRMVSGDGQDAWPIQTRCQFQIANGTQGMDKAANMRQLEWDDDLAAVAQKWADQCSFDHDDKPNK